MGLFSETVSPSFVCVFLCFDIVVHATNFPEREVDVQSSGGDARVVSTMKLFAAIEMRK